MRLGDYEITGELGRGGAGVVYRGRGPDGQDVAVKVLLQPHARDAAARFDRERRLLAALGEAEGFVPLVASGDAPAGPFLVMPFVAGGTLRAELRRGPLAVGRALELGISLARALGRAHAAGIVHRDLKPENVLLGDGGQPLIADLGLAKHFRDDQASSASAALSKTGEVRGTALYMAPEQARSSQDVGPPADVFALGVILYEALAGDPPFRGDSVMATLAQAASGEHEPLRARRPDVRRPVARVIERALRAEPADRPRDGEALARALEAARLARDVSPGAVVAALGVVAIAAGLSVVLGSRPAVGTVAPRVAVSPPAPPTRPAPAPPPVPPPPPVPAPAPVPPPASPPGPRLRPGPTVVLEGGRSISVQLWRLPSGDDLELVLVPAGDVTIGSDERLEVPYSQGEKVVVNDNERPVHRRSLPAFYIARTETTWRHYLAFAQATTRSHTPMPAWAGEKHPVVHVGWNDAAAFCAWAGLRLPGEVEWEKAARGTDERRYPWGDVWQPTRCNFCDSSSREDLPWRDRKSSDGHARTAAVGSYPGGASPCGALDLAGNVAEWCQDVYDERAHERHVKGEKAPPAVDNAERVMRPGSLFYAAVHSRVSARIGRPPSRKAWSLGFRAALSAE